MIKRISIILCFFILLTMFNIKAEAFLGWGKYTVDMTGGEISVVAKVGGNITTDRETIRDMADIYFARLARTASFFTGFTTICLVVILILKCVGAVFVASENWFFKRNAMFSIPIIFIASALSGSVTLILVIAQNLLV